jgi:hypothetical protein
MTYVIYYSGPITISILDAIIFVPIKGKYSELKKGGEMLKYKMKWSALLLFIMGFYRLSGQEITTTTGGNASGSGGSVSYTVGQIAYSTQTGTTGSATEGVQQPFEIYIVAGLTEGANISLVMSTYPNPANEYVILKVENIQTEKLTYVLYDLNGKQLDIKNVESSETTIATSHLAVSTYFLKVFQNNKELKTFKIIKN